MVLLDTHTLIWMLFEDSRLSERAKKAMKSNVCCVSIASIWEMAIKTSLGKLRLPKSLEEIITECKSMGIRLVNVTIDDCFRIQELPWIHRDPFDRIIIAHAMTENMSLITHDGHIQQYEGINAIW